MRSVLALPGLPGRARTAGSRLPARVRFGSGQHMTSAAEHPRWTSRNVRSRTVPALPGEQKHQSAQCAESQRKRCQCLNEESREPLCRRGQVSNEVDDATRVGRLRAERAAGTRERRHTQLTQSAEVKRRSLPESQETRPRSRSIPIDNRPWLPHSPPPSQQRQRCS